MIAEGYTNAEIAKILCRSVATVRNHRANLMKKLDLHRVAELIRFAAEEGIIKLEVTAAMVSPRVLGGRTERSQKTP